MSPPGPLLDSLRGPGRSAGRGVSQEPQQPVQSQSGGDEGRGTPVLPGRPGHLAQSPHGLPAHAVKVAPRTCSARPQFEIKTCDHDSHLLHSNDLRLCD